MYTISNLNIIVISTIFCNFRCDRNGMKYRKMCLFNLCKYNSVY